MDDNAKILFDVGFSRSRVGAIGLAQGGEARDGHFVGLTAIGTHEGEAVGAASLATTTPTGASAATRGATLATKAHAKNGPSFRILVASAEIDNGVMGKQLWRLFRQNLDTTIKANAAAKVIPCAKTIAEEVMRQQQLQQREKIGTCVSREHWRLHDNEEDMVKDVGLTYETVDDEGRAIYCPICKDF